MVIPAHTRGAASVDERPSGISARARDFGDQRLRVSSIGRRARIDRVETIHEVAAAAGLADAIFTAEVTHADPLPNLPSGLSRSNLLNKANDLVAGNAGIDHAGPLSADGCGIRMANAAGLHANANLSVLRRDNFSLHQVEFARGRHFNCFVGGGHDLSFISITHETGIADSGRISQDAVPQSLPLGQVSVTVAASHLRRKLVADKGADLIAKRIVAASIA